MSDIVYIPAVPLPLQGLWVDQCSCGERFWGRGRRERYELHYRLVHERADSDVQVGIPRAEAEAIYARVNAERGGGAT